MVSELSTLGEARAGVPRVFSFGSSSLSIKNGTRICCSSTTTHRATATSMKSKPYHHFHQHCHVLHLLVLLRFPHCLLLSALRPSRACHSSRGCHCFGRSLQPAQSVQLGSTVIAVICYVICYRTSMLTHLENLALFAGM